MSFNFEPSGLDVQQTKTVNAINTPSKGLLLLCLDFNYPQPAAEINNRFMDLQGENPVWNISKDFSRMTAMSKACKDITTEVDPHDNFISLSENGAKLGVPAVATLLVVSDLFGVRPQTLVGESTSPKNRNNSIQIRAKLAELMVTVSKDTDVSVKELATIINCSVSAAHAAVAELVGVHLLEVDDSKTVRNSYASYTVVDTAREPEITSDPLISDILSSFQEFGGEIIDAKIISKKLGYNVKYAARRIADILEHLENSGTLKQYSSAQMRFQTTKVTKRGKSAFEFLNGFYEELADPSKAFLAGGHVLADYLRKDPETVNRMLRRTPVKRGQRKSTTAQLDTRLPAVQALVESLPPNQPLKTTEIRNTITQTSSTATARLLKNAEKLGLVTRAQRGRELIWTRNVA